MLFQNVLDVELFVFLFFFVFGVYVEETFFLLYARFAAESYLPIYEIIRYDADENEDVCA